MLKTGHFHFALTYIMRLFDMQNRSLYNASNYRIRLKINVPRPGVCPGAPRCGQYADKQRHRGIKTNKDVIGQVIANRCAGTPNAKDRQGILSRERGLIDQEFGIRTPNIRIEQTKLTAAHPSRYTEIK